MQDILEQKIKILRKTRIRKTRMIAILLILSLVVSLDVFWVLRQPGWTLAGDADCKIVEHTHDESCQNAETTCELTEHVHSVSCYSDVSVDVETQLQWQKMFEDYPYTQDLRKDLVGIAQSQTGYCESTRNFEVGDDGVRRGYTRYGAWYGAPYIDWSAAFVSFCLHYAGADPAEMPGNTGAASMAEIWKTLDRFAPAGAYDPAPGDLVFFANNTVGIVTEVQNATCYVVCGDIDNAVCADTLALTDESIIGWGLTGSSTRESEEPTEDPAPNDEYLLDISNGPAVFIVEEAVTQQQMLTYSRRSSPVAISLLDYLTEVDGSYFFTLLDANNQELPKDSDKNYIVKADTGYKLTLSITSHKGFKPGIYQYQIPNNLTVDGGRGNFILKDGTNVGDWIVTDDGLITLMFNEYINSRSDIVISATMGVKFHAQDEPIDFDGKITVTVEKPPEEELATKLNKWGSQGEEGNEKKPDPSKIYWTVEIKGNRNSSIPGSTITDQLSMGGHRFTQSDIEGGLHFGVGEYDPATGEQIAWHAWDVMPGDPNLVWTETGWTYRIPEEIRCKWCPQPVQLGNNGWTYYVEYTSTPDPSGSAGAFWYRNGVTVDGQTMEGWGGFTHGDIQADIIKHGTFHSDAKEGKFLWELQVVVPGMGEKQTADYYWYVMDYLSVRDAADDAVGYVKNDANLAAVTATYNGTTINVPNLKDATAQDPFAWRNPWSDVRDGVEYHRELDLVCRCNCTEENCPRWNAETHDCGSRLVWENADYCHCWVVEEGTVFTFSYQTDDPAVIDLYGGHNNKLQNYAELYYKKPLPDWKEESVKAKEAIAAVPIPGVFKKELTRDFDGYTANYQITINEGKLVLTDGSPLTIHDEMTQTLAFISGSLVVTTEDAAGNTETLKQGTDYTVTYDGSGSKKDTQGNPVHVLEIVILRPQPVMYILNYDTTLIMPKEVTEGIKYTNSATVTLWGEAITDTTVEKVYADINIAAKSYTVELIKTCALTGDPLGGAVFGLFNTQGGLITSGTTDANGKLMFQTNVEEGIILREHVLYYMQELKAPPGYQLDDTKHWFCFCDEATDSCETCDALTAETGAVRIPFEQIGKLNVVNEIMYYDLPATGGPGIYPLLLVSVIWIVTPLVYIFIRRRKRERRGIG